MGANEFIDNKQGELEINRYYWFTLIKTTTMPDGIEYYVLEDEFNNRHLMEKEPYETYGFQLDQKVEIRIDKINCKGKVFFEPKHPRYSLGETVEVEFIGHDIEIDKFKEEVLVLKVKDPEGNISSIQPISKEQRNPEYTVDFLKCEVYKISKGKLVLKQIG
ncbi:MAG: hypothetical protein JW729_10500 [Bacteroidales bacterium]|nr:hypothetical protein [Bacteroidales bacterium]